MREITIKNYDNWMRNIVKSIHYSNNEKMINAYKKIKEYEINKSSK